MRRASCQVHFDVSVVVVVVLESTMVAAVCGGGMEVAASGGGGGGGSEGILPPRICIAKAKGAIVAAGCAFPTDRRLNLPLRVSC